MKRDREATDITQIKADLENTRKADKLTREVPPPLPPFQTGQQRHRTVCESVKQHGMSVLRPAVRAVWSGSRDHLLTVTLWFLSHPTHYHKGHPGEENSRPGFTVYFLFFSSVLISTLFHLFLILLHLCVYVCASLHVCICMCVCVSHLLVGRPEDNVQESILSLYHVEPGG